MSLEDKPVITKILAGLDLSQLPPAQRKILNYCARLPDCETYLERLGEPSYLPIAALIKKIHNKLYKDAERAAMAAVKKYEYARSIAANRKVIATRTRRMAEKKGWRNAVEHAVVKQVQIESSGFEMLRRTGYLECSYELFIVHNPLYFSDKAIGVAKARLKEAGFQDKIESSVNHR